MSFVTNKKTRNIERMVQFYKIYKDDIYISIMSQYTPLGTAKNFSEISERIKPEYYNALVDYAEYCGIVNAFIQDVSSGSEEYIPEFYDEKEKI